MPSLNHHITNRFDGHDCLESIPAFRLVCWGMDASEKVGFELCGPTDVPCAINGPKPGTFGAKLNPDDHTMYNLRDCGEWVVEFETDAAPGAKIYTGSDGRVTKTPVAGATYLGIATKVIRAPRTENGKMVYDRAAIVQDMATGTTYASP